MAYGMLTSRKIHYTWLVNEIQMQLDQICQEKQSLLTLSAHIADGVVTPEEFASDPKNVANYLVFQEEVGSYRDSNLEGAMDSFKKREYSAEESDALRQYLSNSMAVEFAKQKARELSVVENQLDMQQKRLETKLTAAQKQLEAIEQAEARAVQNATPKYAGLG